jgi:hypothetical protein
VWCAFPRGRLEELIPGLRAQEPLVAPSKASHDAGASKQDVAHRFRELLWFWNEYYSHRGRDQLSLEFSCHVKYPEWRAVAELLCSTEGPSSLVSTPVVLPCSPYDYPPTPMRGS